MSLLLGIEQLRSRKRSRKGQSRRTIDGITFEPSADSPLCQFCTTRGIWHHLSGKYIFTPADWLFGFITEPADVDNPERRDCPFCKLVFDVLPENAFAEEHRHNYRREGATKVYCSLRPICIKVRNERFTSFVVAYNFLEYKSFTHKIFQNYRGWIGLDTNARRKFNTPGIAAVKTPDSLDPNLIRKWMKRCQSYHHHCSDKHLDLSDRSWSTLMIDVQEYCLVDARTDCTYTALSYVWGQVRTLQTTRANLTSLMVPGALRNAELWRQIPQVVRDGIVLTQAIDIPYLWVDCLCIVQEDFARKHDQIARMDKIYLQAHITIIPYNGKTADTAIPGVRPDTRATFSTPVSIPGSNDEEGLSMVLTSSPDWGTLELDSIHESRAWTLQEISPFGSMRFHLALGNVVSVSHE